MSREYSDPLKILVVHGQKRVIKRVILIKKEAVFLSEAHYGA